MIPSTDFAIFSPRTIRVNGLLNLITYPSTTAPHPRLPILTSETL
ncbi:hypothetical protein HMPREF9577_02018 [Cutibacterium acnes HL110PA3]|nr:hypothetical protein HMPREF9603_01244 [Cutibacterium acnes HL001PA1]EFT25152.1 hypothetical protein HMPREF9577_02018 [Cutibacterium acnes HL110PA3]